MLNPVTVSHFDFTALPNIFVRESFAREESGEWRIYAGIHNDNWQFDEVFFSEIKGAYSGVSDAPPRVVAAQITLETATVESIAINARGSSNFDPVLRVASGTNLIAKSTLNYAAPSTLDYIPSTATDWRLYNVTTGNLVASAGINGVLGVVSDGTYVLWARCDTFVRDIPLNRFGEWSAVKVKVGFGAWGWNPSLNVYPGPGSPLYSKTGTSELEITESNQKNYVYAFDPLARIISASCVTWRDVVLEDGSVDIPAGSLLIAGVRASRGGPQTALWVLGEDHSARLLAAETTYSDGKCECLKTNHFSSDIEQGSDGRIYVLSECDLNVYDPDRSDVFSRLRPFPEETYGHPGGQALRFPAGDLTFWSEDLLERHITTNDGRNFYNQLVYRAGVKNDGGIGGRWHGTNCAELFRGKLFAVRQDKDHLVDETATQTIDSITAGRWDRESVVTQSAVNQTWQRLRRCGEKLYAFGYKVLDEDVFLPTLHIANDRSFAEAEFPYFIRRATSSLNADGEARLLVAARDQEEGIGAANRVVEFQDIESRICENYDETNHRFNFSVSEFELLGGNVAKLPHYLRFVAQTGTNAGGVWVGVSAITGAGSYLTLSVVGGQIRYSGTLPYDSAFWGVLCMIIDSDGDITIEIKPTCTNAQCVIDLLPTGTKWRHIRLTVPDEGEPLWAAQVSDVNPDRRLQVKRDQYPILWLRTDSDPDVPFDDLESYTLLASFGSELFLPEPVRRTIDAVVIYRPEVMPCQAPTLARRA